MKNLQDYQREEKERKEKNRIANKKYYERNSGLICDRAKAKRRLKKEEDTYTPKKYTPILKECEKCHNKSDMILQIGDKKLCEKCALKQK